MGNRSYLYLTTGTGAENDALPVAEANGNFPSLWQLLLAEGSATPAIDAQRVFGDAGTDNLSSDAGEALLRLRSLASFVGTSPWARRAPWLPTQFEALEQHLTELVDGIKDAGGSPRFSANLDELSWMVEAPEQFIEDCRLDCNAMAQDLQQAIDEGSAEAIADLLELSNYQRGAGGDAWAYGFGFAGLVHPYFHMRAEARNVSFADFARGVDSDADAPEGPDAPPTRRVEPAAEERSAMTPGGIGKVALTSLAALLGSIVAGVAAGYLAMVMLPCGWFGSHFEGACGYGVMWAAIGTGVAVAALVLGCFTYRVLRSFADPNTANQEVPRQLVWTWGVSFLLMAAVPWLRFAALGNMVVGALGLLTGTIFLVSSAVLAKRLGLSAFIALLAFAPYVGSWVVAAILLARLVKRKRAAH